MTDRVAALRIGLEGTAPVLGAFAAALTLTNLAIAPIGLMTPLIFLAHPLASFIKLLVLMCSFHVVALALLANLAEKTLFWPNLANLRAGKLVISAGAGAGVAACVSLPVHFLIFQQFSVSTGYAAETATPLVGLVFFLTDLFEAVVLAPLAEEIGVRGILFENLKSLNRTNICFWSVFTFCFAHYLAGGLPKVVAVLPMAILFVILRLRFGSWPYAAAAHAAGNLVATVAVTIPN